MWFRLALALPALALLATSAPPQPALAQAWQCRAPANLSRPTPEYPDKGEVRRTPITGYVLALSWSREHCRGRKNDPADALQCGKAMGEFGFILHGLWPQGSGSNHPQWCRKAEPLSRKVVAENICMTPSVRLLQHEWAKHGTCMARKPETYFGAARLLFNALEFPDMDRLSREGEREGTLTAGRLAEEFALHNDGLPESAIRIQTNRHGWLEEVRICLDRKFKPKACAPSNRSAPAKAQIKIWRGS